jgi:pimeloyl-ACP methyl ester carboxylesterase
MPFFTAPDGVRLHYGLEGSGPPLVLHLGAGADATVWGEAGYLETLAAANTCVLFDHRGHGHSDHPSSVAANHIDRYADDVAALASHLGHSSVSFFGWSNGVAVGLRAADHYPDLFNALVLFGSMARRASTEQLAESTRQRLVAMRANGWPFLLDAMVAAEKYPVPRWFLNRVLATDAGPWLAYTEARPLWNWSPWDALPNVSTPTLILAGELEDPDDVMGEVAALMPDANRIRIPDREHINAFLYSDFVAPLVREFLATRRAPAPTQGKR